MISGVRYLYFGGTGYFGFPTHPEVLQAAQKAVADFGMDTATFRDIFGTSPLHLSAKKKAREFLGTEDAIYLPSGYLINIAGFQALAELRRFDAMFVDVEAHWSIIDFMHALQKPVYTFGHGDANDLERKLKAYLKPGQKPLVASDGIFPTFGKIAPVPAYLPLVEAYYGCLWLDDCHALGVLGSQRRGTYEHYGLHSERLYFGATLSKAVGAHGGIIARKEEFILPVRAGHIANGANASVSAAAAAAVKGMQLMMTQLKLREQLWSNARQLKSGLKAMGFEPGRYSGAGSCVGAEDGQGDGSDPNRNDELWHSRSTHGIRRCGAKWRIESRCLRKPQTRTNRSYAERVEISGVIADRQRENIHGDQPEGFLTGLVGTGLAASLSRQPLPALATARGIRQHPETDTHCRYGSLHLRLGVQGSDSHCTGNNDC